MYTTRHLNQAYDVPCSPSHDAPCNHFIKGPISATAQSHEFGTQSRGRLPRPISHEVLIRLRSPTPVRRRGEEEKEWVSTSVITLHALKGIKRLSHGMKRQIEDVVRTVHDAVGQWFHQHHNTVEESFNIGPKIPGERSLGTRTLLGPLQRHQCREGVDVVDFAYPYNGASMMMGGVNGSPRMEFVLSEH
ncbi:Hypothetical protein D9617_27g044650 [Elsinoe fawcettii]|nr:Hypothetical protein D9617_27g044650 [Elsinoe fawcettii]